MTTAEVIAPPRGEVVSSDELVARAEEIARTLVSEQAATEQRHYYSQETHEAFARAGLYRLLTPRRYGGHEVDLETYFKVCMAIARGCPSTGWCFMLGTSHALTAASYLSEKAQDEVFADTDFISPLTANPLGTARRDGEGWRINATHPFASGAPYASYYLGHAIIEGEEAEGGGPALLAFIAPRSAWTMLDDWGALLGQKGSGSHSVRFENAWIPDHYALPHTNLLFIDPTAGTPGLRLHGNPLYAGSSLSFLILEMAGLAIGIAQGALDEYGEHMRTKKTTFPPIQRRSESVDYQRWYGTASNKIATARAAFLNVLGQWGALAASGGFNQLGDDRIVGVGKEIVELCWQAVADNIVRSAGSGALMDGQRMQRVFRDMSILHSHTGTVSFTEFATRDLTQRTFAE